MIRAIAAGLCIHSVWLVLKNLIRLDRDQSIHLIDFPSFFYVADIVFNWRQSPYVAEYVAGYTEGYDFWVYPFVYPPSAIPLFYPFSLVGYETGAVVMILANWAAFVYLALKLSRMLIGPIAEHRVALLCLLILAVYDPITHTFLTGQVNLFVTILIVLAWERSERGQSAWAGVFLGLATVLKTYPAVLFLVLLMRRDLRGLMSGGAVVAAFLGLSLILFPAEFWRQWLFIVAPSADYAETPFALFPPGHSLNQSFNGLFSRLVADVALAKAIGYGASAVVLAASAWTLWRRRGLEPALYYGHAFSVMILTTFFIAPLTWPHHLVAAVPAMFFLLGQVFAPDRAVSRGVQRAAIILVALFALPWRYTAYLSDYIDSIPTLLAVGLWVMLAALPAVPQRADSRTAQKALAPA